MKALWFAILAIREMLIFFVLEIKMVTCILLRCKKVLSLYKEF